MPNAINHYEILKQNILVILDGNPVILYIHKGGLTAHKRLYTNKYWKTEKGKEEL